MSRKIKNVIMILLIIVLVVSMYFTINHAKNNTTLGRNMARENTFMQLEGTQEQQPLNNGQMETPPAKPEGEDANMQQQNMEGMIPPDANLENMSARNEFGGNTVKLTIIYYILFGIESLILALIIMYLIMSKFNQKILKETFVSTDKIIIYILSVIILTAVLTLIDTYITNRILINNNNYNPFMQEETTQKDVTAEDVDKGVSVADNNINLNEYNSNVTITKSGIYTLTGEFEHSVLVNADGDVTLNLENVSIKNEITAAIANISANTLIINLEDGTSNTLSDGGSSEYDGCIYSTGPLIIEGNGKLNVYGNQEEGEGIATETNDITINGGNIHIECKDDGLNAGGDGGTITLNDGTVYIKASGDGVDSNKDIVINGGVLYVMGSSLGGNAGIDADAGFAINGGLVIALGSDMLVEPVNTSTQHSLCFNLDSTIESGTLITLVNENDEVIVSFEANENFKTLIISDEDIQNGTYYLYRDGENSGILTNGIYDGGQYTKGTKISISNNTSFTVSDIITRI